MLDLNLITRYFDVKIGDYELQLEPCSLKTLRKLSEMNKDTTFAELTDLVKIIINKNKTNYKIPDEVIESMSMPQMMILMQSYIDWLTDEKTNNPN